MTKTLQGLIKLGCKVAVYVPGTNGVNNESDNSKHVAQVASSLAGMFGGSTSTAAIGYWVSPAAGLVAEKTTLVYAYATSELLEQHMEEVLSLCWIMKAELAQESIALEINGEMYFV